MKSLEEHGKQLMRSNPIIKKYNTKEGFPFKTKRNI